MAIAESKRHVVLYALRGKIIKTAIQHKYSHVKMNRMSYRHFEHDYNPNDNMAYALLYRDTPLLSDSKMVLSSGYYARARI